MYRKILKLLTVVLIVSALGCAYYNTFYNAKRYFKEAQATPLRDNGRPAPNAIQKYNKAIKKCGIILTDYKDSKYADDALFMLAQCLYYKGTNYIQAIEQFNDIIKFYPESEFVPEARLYVAMSQYEFNQKDKAYKMLQDFINNDNFKEHHPQALNIMSEYYIRDENYIQAQYYLQNIIDSHTDSDEYEKAFYKLGKSYHEAGNYSHSNEIFNSILTSRISKKTKLNSRYYISLNHLLLKEYEPALKAITKLLKKEYRLGQISKIQLLKARTLSSKGETKEAITIFENIITNNKKSKLSAEASYYLAETYFKQVQDYERAIEYYNMVKTEYSNSEFVEESLSRSVVTSQIIQYNNPDIDIPAEELVAQHFKLAEYYIQVIDLPDSAIAVYDNIIGQIEYFNVNLDSLNLILQELPEDELIQPADTTATTINDISDSLSAEIDSLVVEEIVEDSIAVLTRDDINNLITATENNLSKYREEFVPYARFIKIWIFKNIYKDSVKVHSEFEILNSESPENKYTFAAINLMQDTPVEFITYQEKTEFEEYDIALGYIDTDLILAMEKLNEIRSNPQHKYYFDAVYGLGYLNYFILADSAAAKEYFDLILSESSDPDMKLYINKFYDGKSFKNIERLEYITAQEQLEKEIIEEENIEEITTPDDNENLEPEDNYNVINTDSLSIDSLFVSMDRKAAILEKREILLPPNIELQEGDHIVVKIEVLETGIPGRIDILKNLTGYEEQMIDIITRSIQEWRFQTAIKKGKPVKSNLVDTIFLKK